MEDTNITRLEQLWLDVRYYYFTALEWVRYHYTQVKLSMKIAWSHRKTLWLLVKAAPLLALDQVISVMEGAAHRLFQAGEWVADTVYSPGVVDEMERGFRLGVQERDAMRALKAKLLEEKDLF